MQQITTSLNKFNSITKCIYCCFLYLFACVSDVSASTLLCKVDDDGLSLEKFGIEFYGGNDVEGYLLAPSDDTEEYSIWNFSQEEGKPEQEGEFNILICNYNNGTRSVFKLPVHTKYCIVNDEGVYCEY